LCYRPAVFFRNLSLIALSLPQAKIRRAFKKCYCFKVLIFLSRVDLKFRKISWR
jgi:hypothetical protein